MNFKRENDLQEIFDAKWQANHEANNNVRREKDKQEDFDRRMFGIRNKEELRREMRQAHSVENQVNNLKQRMNNANTFNRNNFGG